MAALVCGQDVRADQKARDHKKNVDTGKTALRTGHAIVVGHHGQHGQGPQGVDVRPKVCRLRQAHAQNLLQSTQSMSMRIFKKQVVGGVVADLEINLLLTRIGDEIQVLVQYAIAKAVRAR